MVTTSGRATQALYDTLEAFVGHGDTYLVLQQLTEQAAALLGWDDAALLLRDGDGLGLATGTSFDAKAFEGWHLERDEPGPCTEAFDRQVIVRSPDLADAASRWPGWASGAGGVGYRSVVAVPLVMEEQSIGALNLLSRSPGAQVDEALALRFAQLATTMIATEGRRRSAERLAGQLQTALDSRVVIEQAKGILAERLKVEPDVAFQQLRTVARSRRQTMSAAAREVIASVDTATV